MTRGTVSRAPVPSPPRSYRHDPDMRALLAMATLAFMASLGPSPRAHATGNISVTVHNLSPSGPGTQKDGRAAGTCAYCHTPHNTTPIAPLWSRSSSGITYQLYSSMSMQATVDQPTGSSRLCLSCHDGILALSSVRLAGTGSTGAAASSPLMGKTVLGSDLRASHPVSLTYDAALVAKRGELTDPKALPSSVRLDANRQLQCTSCHDAHDNSLGNFLRMDNSQATLCMACHRLSSWETSSHATSTATWTGAGTNPWPPNGKPFVAGNACNDCHRSHAAAHGERLLARASETENCTICHGGTVGKKDIAAEFAGAGKISRHPIEAAQWVHAPGENSSTMQRHVTCVDCHNPHQARAASAGDTRLAGPLRGVAGVSSSGAPIPSASYEYQLCLKCHGEPSTVGPTRADRGRNVADKVNPSNKSYHPIVAAAKNGTARGLAQGYTASSTIGCIDCHNNNDGSPRGPHASRFAPILERSYVTTDPAVESPAAYAICYKCHDRNAIVSAPALSTSPSRAAAPRTKTLTPAPKAAAASTAGFSHWLHVVKNQTSCAVCHDAHGSRTNPRLINFMTRDVAGRPVVSANSMGQLEYIATGLAQGTCNLSCHGKDHVPSMY